MKEIPEHCINLNIWYYLPETIWNKLINVYQKMPGWKGFDKEGMPYWFSANEAEKSISISVEPSGLQISAKMDSQEWIEWLRLFKEVATQELGFPVGEPEDGFE
jgi:hypothetical protein